MRRTSSQCVLDVWRGTGICYGVFDIRLHLCLTGHLLDILQLFLRPRDEAPSRTSAHDLSAYNSRFASRVGFGEEARMVVVLVAHPNFSRYLSLFVCRAASVRE